MLPHPGCLACRDIKLLEKNWARVNVFQDGEEQDGAIVREIQLFSNFSRSRATCTILTIRSEIL